MTTSSADVARAAATTAAGIERIDVGQAADPRLGADRGAARARRRPG